MVHEEHGHLEIGKNIRDAVFGAEDGLVSIFGAVTGLASAAVSPMIIVLGGMAAAVSAALSMAAGSYISSKSEKEYIERERDVELEEMREHPEHLKEEMKFILGERGFSGEALDLMAEALCRDEETCTTIIMEHEGLPIQSGRVPLKNAFVMFFSFLLAATVPIFPYLLMEPGTALRVSVLLTSSALFLLGAGKARITKRNWFWSGLEMLLVGAVAGGAGFVVGQFFPV